MNNEKFHYLYADTLASFSTHNTHSNCGFICVCNVTVLMFGIQNSTFLYFCLLLKKIPDYISRMSANKKHTTQKYFLI